MRPGVNCAAALTPRRARPRPGSRHVHPRRRSSEPQQPGPPSHRHLPASTRGVRGGTALGTSPYVDSGFAFDPIQTASGVVVRCRDV
jgi:hypothetical protein